MSSQGKESSEAPLTVLLVITGLGVGGAERVVVDLADGLYAEGHRPVIVYLRGVAQVLPLHREIPLECLELEGVMGVPKALFRLRALIRKYRPDVVHSHLAHANILARLVRLLVPIRRLISTAHNTVENSRLRFLAYRWTNWLADLSTNVSAEAVASYERQGAVAKGGMQVVNNGIDVNRFQRDEEAGASMRQALGISADDNLLVSIGRLEPPKDFGNLVCALERVSAIRRDWQCVIAGEGSLRNALTAQMSKGGLTHQVHLLGVRNDVSKLLSAADFFVLSSAWEGFPLVVGEAMACSTPVVATDCGGVAEFLGAQARFLVPARNSVALSDALLDALDTAEAERRRIGDSHRRRVVEKFSFDAALKQWICLYRAGDDSGRN